MLGCFVPALPAPNLYFHDTNFGLELLDCYPDLGGDEHSLLHSLSSGYFFYLDLESVVNLGNSFGFGQGALAVGEVGASNNSHKANLAICTCLQCTILCSSAITCRQSHHTHSCPCVAGNRTLALLFTLFHCKSQSWQSLYQYGLVWKREDSLQLELRRQHSTLLHQAS